MTQPQSLKACPKCGTSAHVREKLILIDELNAAHLLHHPDERSACACEGNLSVDGLKPEFVRDGSLQQFIVGLYCEACGLGFVPEEMLKPEPTRWRLSKEGWHRVNSDGTLGPPTERAE
jgi:hypothetical protein